MPGLPAKLRSPKAFSRKLNLCDHDVGVEISFIQFHISYTDLTRARVSYTLAADGSSTWNTGARRAKMAVPASRDVNARASSTLRSRLPQPGESVNRDTTPPVAAAHRLHTYAAIGCIHIPRVPAYNSPGVCDFGVSGGRGRAHRDRGADRVEQ